MYGGSADDAPPMMAPRRRQYAVMLGLLFVFLGLAGLAVVVPLTPPNFPGDLPPLAVGLLGLLVGGMLLGYGVGARRPSSR